MAYNNNRVMAFTFPAVAIGAGDTTRSIRLPKGMSGRLFEIHVEATVLFTAVTTSAFVNVGVSGSLSRFGSLSIGALAAGDSKTLTGDIAVGGASTINLNTNAELPADTKILVTLVAPTGGSPAGTATVTVYINPY